MCAELTHGFYFVEVQRRASSAIIAEELVQMKLHTSQRCCLICLSCDSSHCTCRDRAEQEMLLKFYFQLSLLKALQAKD